MFRIGAFSKITNTTIRALHHYETLGLFAPHYIDRKTGYRFYTSGQISDLNKIKVLQELGFSLRQIKEMLTNKDFNSFNYELEQQKEKLENDITTLKDRLILLESLTGNKEELRKYHITLKEIPSRNVIRIRCEIDDYYEENLLWDKLYKDKVNEQTSFAKPYQCMTIYHDEEYKEKNIDIEVQISVEENYDISNDLSEQVPGFKMISTVFSGSYDQMSEVCESLAMWAESQNYELSGVMVNIPIVSPAQSSNPDEWVTEAGYIIIEKEYEDGKTNNEK